MVYSSETSKWKAYQFNDPFASGSFFVCNKINQIFCRPDCDSRPITNLKLEIKFLNNSNQAISMGYKPCEHCDPINTSMAIDVNLLIKCVSTVNNRIGFIPPLLDENEESNSLKIKENIIESKKDFSYQKQRHASVPNISIDNNKSIKDLSLSKNDSDHYRLVDLACRHLALAAAINVFQPKPIISTTEEQEQNASLSSSPNGKKRRRRRGGVLGFKELAAKSKLSAWHFHRVFKSVTGLTPKTYGDKCWEFVKKIKESGEYTSFEEYSISSPTTNSDGISTNPNTPQLLPMSNTSTSCSPQDSNSNVALYPITPPSQQQTTNNINNNSNINSVISEIPEFGFPSTSSTSTSIDPFFNFSTGLNDINDSTRAFSYHDLTSLKNKQDSLTGSLFNNTNNLFQYTQFQPQQPQPQQQPQQQSQSIDPLTSTTSTTSTTTTTTGDSYNNLFDESYGAGHVNLPIHQNNMDYSINSNGNTFDELYSISTFDENLFNNDDTLFQIGNVTNDVEDNKKQYGLMTTIGL